ncbi:MAG: restriction endonuclease subunit S [Anaerovibrio sp.]|uniref:restriction endonuclease subunit S n=1 Tax=Anaerovibrio sp. TaxID=1872532 RepID=UPI0025C296BC|nr:restriction endonuclease subunit S [Anaerovibrio sp.]MBE6099473.1 restriction endonuclease subunit S [Anaerovibrio sp.]
MKVKLSDITKYSKGVQINGDDLIDDGEYIYLNGGINPSGRWSSSNVSGDTVTISEGGNSSGYVNYITEPFWCGAHCYYLYEGPSNSKYLYYALKSQQNRLFAIRSGACMPNIKKSDLGNFELEFDYNERKQDEVVAVLSGVELVIARRQKELELIDELIKARFVEMFGTLHDNEKSFKVVTVDDVCTLIKDGTHQTPQYTEDRQRGFKFLSSKDVMSQKIDWTDIKYIPQELHEKLYATIKPQRNDILMSKNGVNYGVAAVNDTDEVFDIYVSLALLRPKNSIDPVFLRCAINSPETKTQFDSSIKGIGVPNLYLGEIKKTKIFLPPMEIQKEFVLFVEQVDKSKFVVPKVLDSA